MISTKLSHPALVSDDDFVAAQAIRAARPTQDGSPRVYLLAGLLKCGFCGRRLDSHWANGRPGYRCRHGYTSARPREAGLKFLYIREDRLLAELLAHVGGRERREPAEIVSAIRAKDLVIVCQAATRVVPALDTEELVPGDELFMG
ncbi:zinc ribbon domain-containing protein [Actinomadura sp. ATCC 31491]|uniref:Zinc ribbon domain-containing protein n=1 Tax=Actinomadura luzonensis TaxID=2805427 RepID=A0ABT0FPI8_9ACTN|nr:zinc ribbon domain-containing protein [Actinomadura luzonensis]MCK2214068.1 zinc ribbon domain-containing protein [Actinomadura luzonensis]